VQPKNRGNNGNYPINHNNAIPNSPTSGYGARVTYITQKMSQNMRFLQFRFAKCQSKMLHLIYQQLQRRNKMAVSNATYKVGDTFTTQKSKVTGTIEEITPQANGNVRVKLMVDGKPRYTTWTAKSE
jgi:hypothetical protein